jgi:S-(hydroxymethyl)glutathione dehydrogenase/alcohol dehydrogenase
VRRGGVNSKKSVSAKLQVGGGARGRTDVPKIVDWYMDGRIAIDPLITHTLKLEDINRGFELMEGGESIRSVVVY